MTFEGITVLSVSAVACATDLRSRRIPNWLTFGAAAAAIVFQFVEHGLAAAGSSLVGWIVGVALFMPIFLVGGQGAGDLKLVGAIGAWLGTGAVVRVVLYSAIAGGVMGVVVALASGYLRAAFTNLRTILTSWWLGIAQVPGMTLADAKGPRLAYALPITAGTVVTLWLQ